MSDTNFDTALVCEPSPSVEVTSEHLLSALASASRPTDCPIPGLLVIGADGTLSSLDLRVRQLAVDPTKLAALPPHVQGPVSNALSRLSTKFSNELSTRVPRFEMLFPGAAPESYFFVTSRNATMYYIRRVRRLPMFLPCRVDTKTPDCLSVLSGPKKLGDFSPEEFESMFRPKETITIDLTSTSSDRRLEHCVLDWPVPLWFVVDIPHALSRSENAGLVWLFSTKDGRSYHPRIPNVFNEGRLCVGEETFPSISPAAMDRGCYSAMVDILSRKWNKDLTDETVRNLFSENLSVVRNGDQLALEKGSQFDRKVVAMQQTRISYPTEDLERAFTNLHRMGLLQ